MCPYCNNKLIPILYGYSDPKYADMHKKGLVFLVSTTFHTKNDFSSYCNKCKECFYIKLSYKFD